jgi:CBS domain-containing protein
MISPGSERSRIGGGPTSEPKRTISSVRACQQECTERNTRQRPQTTPLPAPPLTSPNRLSVRSGSVAGPPPSPSCSPNRPATTSVRSWSSNRGTVVGIVSERDVVRWLNDRGRDILDAPVSDIMTAEVFTCPPDCSVEEVTRTMAERNIRHMPVVVGDDVAGVVSLREVGKTASASSKPRANGCTSTSPTDSCPNRSVVVSRVYHVDGGCVVHQSRGTPHPMRTEF